MFSFKIRDRQTSGPIRLLSVDGVGIARDGVLGVAQFVLQIRGRQTSGPIRLLLAECVRITRDGVLGGAQFVLQTVMSGQ